MKQDRTQYINEWKKKSAYQFQVQLNLEKDKEIIDVLKASGNKTQLIRNALIEYIKKQKERKAVISERIRALNQANINYVYRLTEYSDKKLRVKPDKEGLLISVKEQGKIEGYLEALQDTGIINKYDLKALYHHYNIGRKF